MNFNLKRNGGSDRIFSDDISNIEVFRQEMLRCFNYTGNNYLSTSVDSNSVNKMML